MVRQSPQLTTLNASTDGHSTSPPVPGTTPLLMPCNVLESMRVENETAVSSATSHEVMAGIADDEADVMLPREINRHFDVLASGRKDDVGAVVSTCTGG